ncbi:MAG: SDR family NAD(P)-dependent oxidoreductase, partial [Pseudomonadota bacterium]
LTAGGLESYRLDYEDAQTIEAAFDETMTRTDGRLDALFNNGAYAIPGATEDFPADAFRAIFEANFFGWHDLTRRVIPVMRQQGGGRIVQCSSVLAFAALRFRSPYVATKHALKGYSDTLRYELAGTGVHVIQLEPGPIDTKIRINSRRHFERWIEIDGSAWARSYRDALHKRLYADDLPKDRFELTCEATTAKLVRALDAPRPHARYMVTTPTYFLHWAKRLLPGRWVDSILIRN